MKAIHIDTIYESEAFRMLSPHMKDRTAVGIIFAVMCADAVAAPGPGNLFAEFERYCKDSLEAGDERDREHKELVALREEAARRDNLKIVIGDLTMEHIFRPKASTNIADVNQQALWDRVESVLSELQKLKESHKSAELMAMKYEYHANAGYPAFVIESMGSRIARLTEDNAMYDKQLRAATEVRGPNAYTNRLASIHEALFHDDPTTLEERRDRFMEEAIELVESLRMSAPYVHKLVDYVYAKAGDRRVSSVPDREIEDVITTLSSLCLVGGYDLSALSISGMTRTEQNVDRIREKRKTRHGRGPLPGFDPEITNPHVYAEPLPYHSDAVTVLAAEGKLTPSDIAYIRDVKTTSDFRGMENVPSAPLGGKTASDIVRANIEQDHNPVYVQTIGRGLRSVAKDDSQVAPSGFSSMETLAQPGDHISPTFNIDGLPGIYSLTRIK